MESDDTPWFTEEEKRAGAKFKGAEPIYPTSPPIPADAEIVTEAIVEACRTAKGGFTRASLAWLGVPWPPVHGWRREILGKPRRPLHSASKSSPESPDKSAGVDQGVRPMSLPELRACVSRCEIPKKIRRAVIAILDVAKSGDDCDADRV